jgi:hypothetical protein
VQAGAALLQVAGRISSSPSCVAGAFDRLFTGVPREAGEGAAVPEVDDVATDSHGPDTVAPMARRQ